ncbi:MAG: DUF4365 domain-containing protein [Acidobacteriota bacterium]|nr:DUF4365 domain-containing protein [Acidobacteriota bacterium]
MTEKKKRLARRKQRVVQHVMEDNSYQIIKKLLPQEWVVREFNRPDYGIDLVIELFEVVDKNNEISETLGEFIFVQVKSVKELEVEKQVIYPVDNVAKGIWKENKNEYMNVDVIKYSLDTDTIFTVQETGASVSVLLFVVDLSSSKVYFVCLNDYIDKIILPKKPNYIKQEDLTIKIPVINNLANDNVALAAMKFYGKRSKFLSAFSKFYYQKNEVLHLFETIDFPVSTLRHYLNKDVVSPESEIVSQLKYFIQQLEYLDIWDVDFWDVIQNSYSDLQQLKLLLDAEKINMENVRDTALLTWHRLSNLGNMYEELCREWFLPKFLSMLMSYPNPPEILKPMH